MTPEALAALHARAFTSPPPWSAAAFAAMLADPACFALTRPGALLIGRAAAGEAELLTLATDPGLRRQGLGRDLLAAFEAEARARGALEAFLEVAEDNAAARALYAGAGWQAVGRRPRYYPRAGAAPVAALILRKPLAAAAAP
jgi:ribosomal-protein-alanine N-acetyltransferase